MFALQLKIDRGLISFQNAGVTVLRTNANRVNDVIAALRHGILEELAGGCEHAHHHVH
jgi:predicted Fe-Mo cluster-binding NifX family protein